MTIQMIFENENTHFSWYKMSFLILFSLKLDLFSYVATNNCLKDAKVSLQYK